MKHTVCINVTDNVVNTQVEKSRGLHLPMRLLTALFGDFTKVMVLIPGKSVSGVEIHQQKGGTAHDAA